MIDATNQKFEFPKCLNGGSNSATTEQSDTRNLKRQPRGCSVITRHKRVAIRLRRESVSIRYTGMHKVYTADMGKEEA